MTSPKDPGENRLNIFIDDSMHKELKVLAAREGVTLQSLIDNILAKAISEDLPNIAGLIHERKESRR